MRLGPGREVPEDFAATLGGADALVPEPWRASYAISLSNTGGAGLVYAIDHAAALPWAWRVPVAVERRCALVRLLDSNGLLPSGSGVAGGVADGWVGVYGAWLHVRAFGSSLCSFVPIDGGDGAGLAEAFRALIPGSVWQRLADRRTRFLTEYTPARWSPGGGGERN